MQSASLRLTRKHWMTLSLALAWCAAMFALRHFRPVTEPAGLSEAAALRAELASLPADAAARLQAWRERPSATAGDGHAMLDTLASEGWRVTETKAGPNVVAADAATMRWASIVRGVERLESTPGFAITSLRIETTGSRTVRQFSRVEIGLHVDRELSPANPARARGAGPGSGPGAAGLRETGPGPLSADRAPPPAAIPEAGSGSRSGGASVPATLAPAAGSISTNSPPK